MNINVQNHTAGEQALIGVLESRGDQGKQAADVIRKSGLVTRKVEAWHYTDLRTFLGSFDRYSSQDPSVIAKTMANIPSQFACAELPIVNGAFVRDQASALPEHVSIGDHAGAHKVRGDDDQIGLINAGLQGEGLEVNISPEGLVEDRIALLHLSSGSGISANKHVVSVGDGASVDIVERHLSDGEAAVCTNVVTDLNVGKAAVVNWVIDQEVNASSTHLGQLNVNLAQHAELNIIVLNAGGKLVRQEINVVVSGEDAELRIRGVNLVGDGAHIDVTTVLDHKVPNTVATETFRNVVVGSGSGVFQGRINVAQPAQKTDAQMACNSLLLNDHSSFSAKPELEIFADDVICAHGATVTDIDNDHLFYLMARGIPEKVAREMLVIAFVEEIFDGLELEEICGVLNYRIEEWLGQHG